MVVDADGLNILAENMETLKKVQGPRLLTPHPGEMKRLFPDEKMSRAETATKFCDKTCGHTAFERQPHDRRGSGPSVELQHHRKPRDGDGRHGRCAHGSMRRALGAKLLPNDAARLGAWLCGRAAELAIFNGQASEESLLPRDLLDHLGAAFTDLRMEA